MRKLLLFLFLPTALFAQMGDQLKLVSKAGTIVASENSPFLLRSNQYGLVPLESNLLYLNTSLKKDYDTLSKNFDYGFGIEPHINVGQHYQFLLPEAYIKGRWKSLELYAGRKREVVGLVDTLGSMGSFIWSGNALPVPKVDIGFRDFVPITKGGLLAIKGNFAHGWLGSGDSVNNVLLHQKSLYVRIGKPAWKIKLLVGANHQAQWAGNPTVPFFDPFSGQTFSKFGSSFNDYIKVVTGKSIGKDTGLDMGEVPGVPANEAGNRTGNHLGSVDIGVSFIVNESSRLLVYRQSFFEDGSLFYLNNIADGLLGISFSGKNNFNICIEYLNTTSQGGSIYYGNIPELRGGDNYFNNGIYTDAWTYKGKTIGSSLLNPYFENTEAFALGGEPNQNYIYNNRVEAYHLKANYRINRFTLITHILSSTNKGAYIKPINSNQLSISQSGGIELKHFTLRADIALDVGEYYKNSVGFNLGLLKNWW